MVLVVKVLTVAILVVALSVIFIVGYGLLDQDLKLNPPFYSAESSITIESERALFEATIENTGDTPLIVNEYGFDSDNCVPEVCLGEVISENVCSGLEVLPGESFVVEVECRGVTKGDVEGFNFVIVNTPQGASGPQLSGEFGDSPGLNSGSGSSWIGSSSNSNTGRPGVSGSSPTPSPTNTIPNTPNTNPNVVVQGSSTLGSPFLIGIATPANDATPTINFIVPSIGFTIAGNCRMDVADRSYFDMTTENVCSVNANGEGHCTLSNALTHGAHNLYVACSTSPTPSSTAVYNSESNNLDVHVIIDIEAPVFLNINPMSGSFSSSVNGVVITGDVSGAAACSAGRFSSYAPHVNPYVIQSIHVTPSHFSFTLPLELGNNYGVIICIDNSENFAVYYTDNYAVNIPPISTGVSSLPITPGSAGGGGGGGGSSSDPAPVETASEEPVPPAGDSGKSSSEEGVLGSGKVVRDFNSERTWFSSIAEWFKGLFD